MATVRPRARVPGAPLRLPPRNSSCPSSASTVSTATTRSCRPYVTEDPLLLVGRSGTGKTFLLNPRKRLA